MYVPQHKSTYNYVCHNGILCHNIVCHSIPNDQFVTLFPSHIEGDTSTQIHPCASHPYMTRSKLT